MGATQTAALRGLVQFFWGLLLARVTVLAALPDWMQTQIVDQVTFVVFGGVGVAILRWLESRKGDGLGPRIARRVAKVAMMGLSGKQPVYIKPAADTENSPRLVAYDDGTTRAVLR